MVPGLDQTWVGRSLSERLAEEGGGLEALGGDLAAQQLLEALGDQLLLEALGGVKAGRALCLEALDLGEERLALGVEAAQALDRALLIRLDSLELAPGATPARL